MALDPETILVVDDDPAFRSLVRELLERVGYRVHEAEDGTDAVRVAADEHASVVVLDIDLPGLNGYEVCRRLREQLDPELAVVFVSGERTESLDRTAGLLIGADDYVAKPFDPSELVARVRRFSRSSPRTPEEPRQAGLTSLTPREREVLALLAEGLPAADIAEHLVLSPKTVATHIQHVLAKLDVRTRAQAVAIALHGRAGSEP